VDQFLCRTARVGALVRIVHVVVQEDIWKHRVADPKVLRSRKPIRVTTVPVRGIESSDPIENGPPYEPAAGDEPRNWRPVGGAPEPARRGALKHGPQVAEHESKFRVRRELANLGVELPRKPVIVVVEESEELAMRVRDTRVSRDGDALVLLANDLHARDGRCYFGATVGRSVINNENFPGAVGLEADAFDGAGDEAFAIEQRDDCGDERFSHGSDQDRAGPGGPG